MFDSSREDTIPAKIRRTRWTDNDRSLLLATFGDCITNKKMPSGKQTAEIAPRLPERSIPQIRTQLDDYINGKLGLTVRTVQVLITWSSLTVGCDLCDILFQF